MDTQLQSRIDAAMKYFIEQRWRIYQAAGIVANLQAESLVKHTQAQHGGGPGYGLAQWEGPRQTDFRAFAGHDIHQSTFDEQLAFIQHELLTTQRQAGEALRRTKDAVEAGATVCRFYERPADTLRQMPYRGQLAQKIVDGWPDFSNVVAGGESTA